MHPFHHQFAGVNWFEREDCKAQGYICGRPQGWSKVVLLAAQGKARSGRSDVLAYGIILTAVIGATHIAGMLFVILVLVARTPEI
jgi:hypothetical protein